MKNIFWQRERVNQSPTRSDWSGRRGGVGGHKRDNCRLPALFFCVLALLSGCTNGGYKGPIQTADGQRMEEPDYNY